MTFKWFSLLSHFDNKRCVAKRFNFWFIAVGWTFSFSLINNLMYYRLDCISVCVFSSYFINKIIIKNRFFLVHYTFVNVDHFTGIQHTALLTNIYQVFVCLFLKEKAKDSPKMFWWKAVNKCLRINKPNLLTT